MQSAGILERGGGRRVTELKLVELEGVGLGVVVIVGTGGGGYLGIYFLLLLLRGRVVELR